MVKQLDQRPRLVAGLRGQTKASATLDRLIWANLEDTGHGG
jgi:hypothetical protein